MNLEPQREARLDWILRSPEHPTIHHLVRVIEYQLWGRLGVPLDGQLWLQLRKQLNAS